MDGHFTSNQRTEELRAGGALLGVAAAVGVLAVTVGLVGCAEPFEPYWRVESYRILGVRSEPVTLKPGDLAEVSVLDYRPPQTQVSYEWSWCPVEPSSQQKYECPLKRLAEQGADAGGAADVGSGSGSDAGGFGGAAGRLDPRLFELGTGPTARLPYPGTKEQVLELCRQLQEAITGAAQSSQLGGRLPTRNCSRGFEVAVRVEAETNSGETQVAKKDVMLWTGGPTPNRNPTHDGLALRVAKEADVAKARSQLEWVPPKDRPRSDQWYQVPEEGTTRLLAGMPFEVGAAVAKESVETYRAPPPRGSEREQGPEREERLTFRWFVTDGTLKHAQRIHIPGRNELQKLRTTTFTLDELPDDSCRAGGSNSGGGRACEVTIWSVVRDGRDGLNWSMRRFEIVGEID